MFHKYRYQDYRLDSNLDLLIGAIAVWAMSSGAIFLFLMIFGKA